jgi:hypothetical protein
LALLERAAQITDPRAPLTTPDVAARRQAIELARYRNSTVERPGFMSIVCWRVVPWACAPGRRGGPPDLDARERRLADLAAVTLTIARIDRDRHARSRRGRALRHGARRIIGPAGCTGGAATAVGAGRLTFGLLGGCRSLLNIHVIEKAMPSKKPAMPIRRTGAARCALGGGTRSA